MYVQESPEIFDEESSQDNDFELSMKESLTTQSRQYIFFIEYSKSINKDKKELGENIIKIPLTSDTSVRFSTSTPRLRRALSAGTSSKRHSLQFSPGIYLTTSAKSPIEDAERFSRLEKSGRQAEVLNTLRLLEPRLKRLSILLIEHKPIIHGDIGTSELVPLPLMGEGLGRLLTILLAIADAARRNNVQVFATTHSRECIMATNQAFQESEQYDFRYHRLDLVKGKIKAVSYNQNTLHFKVFVVL